MTAVSIHGNSLLTLTVSQPDSWVDAMQLNPYAIIPAGPEPWWEDPNHGRDHLDKVDIPLGAGHYEL